MITFEEFKENLSRVEKRMADACQAAGRSADSVRLLPVTKNHPVDAVDYALRAGLKTVGENRVQEASGKKADFNEAISWELIGHLQSNKAKEAVETFDRIQSVDSLKLLRRLDRMAGEVGRVLPVLIQCNAGDDPNKYGFSVNEMEGALEAALSAAHLKVDGLMTIAPLDEDPEVAKQTFERLRHLRDDLSAQFSTPLDELSMGMTGDLESAIAAGSTQIRVGTALYGSRGD